MTNRRTFILQSVVASTAFASGLAMAEAPLLAETDAKAKVMGYVEDSAKVDHAKFPKHTEAQMCSNCVLWQGKANDAAGACPLYVGNQTAAKGWCSAYAKKA